MRVAFSKKEEAFRAEVVEFLADYRDLDAFVERSIAEQGVLLERAPHAFPTLLRAVALRLRGLSVAVVIGDPDAAPTRALAERARRVLRPEDAVLVAAPNAAPPEGIARAWLTGREAIDGRATAYVCVGTACSLPVIDPADLVAEIVPRPGTGEATPGRGDHESESA